MKIQLALLYFFLLLTGYSFASTEDSLKTLIQKSDNPSDKLELMVALGEEYSLHKSDSLYSLAENLIKLSEEEADECNRAIGIHYKGNYFYNNGELNEALKFYKETLQIRQKNCDDERTASSYVMIGNVNQVMGNYDVAYESYYNALNLYESIADYGGVSYVYSNMGLVDVSREKYESAKENYQKALEFEDISVEPDSVNLGNIYNNIGGLYEAQEMYDTAVVYFQKAMTIYRNIDRKSGLAHGYNNIGIIFYFQGYPDSCMSYFEKSLMIRKEIGDKKDISQSYNNIGILYQYEEDYDMAVIYSDSALSIAKESQSTEEISDAYLALYESYFASSDYYNAVLNLKLFSDYKDTLSSEKSERTISVLQTKYEAAQKETLLKEQQADLDKKNASIKRQNIIIWSGVLIGILLVALLFVIYNRNKVTKEQNEIINQQKAMVEEKQNEIIDSIKYAKRIQAALLKSEEHESKHLPDHFIFFQPKDIVSGDFYWVHESDKHLYLAVADCTGHGVPGGFLTMLGSAFLNEIILSNPTFTPAEILDMLRDKIVRELSQTGEWGDNHDGMDISLVRLDLQSKELMWAGANNPLWIVRENGGTLPEPEGRLSVYNSLIEIKPDKQPIGIYFVMNPFTNHSIKLNEGDTFYLFSDGYADQFGGDKGKKFKYKALKDLTLEMSHMKMENRKEKLGMVFTDWKGEFEQIDDICIMGVKI